MSIPRYRRVIADQFLDGPRPWTECLPIANYDAGVLPGSALIAGPDQPASKEGRFYGGPTRTFARAGANQSGVIYVADVNTLAGHDMYKNWSWDSVTGIFLDARIPLNVLVPAGANIIKGAGLTTNAQGWFVPATAGQRVLLTAEESFNNNTGVYQHVRARPVPGA